MLIIRKIKSMSEVVRKLSYKGKRIGIVPTMGALHEGHLSLIRRARRDNDIVVVSIFVNPIQFGPKEDFKRYPRPINKDLKLCRKEGVDFVFLPKQEDLYPCSFSTYVFVEGLSNVLCGKSRPGHFQGVATIVAKLFNIVRPHTAYFGQKDAQQAIIIRRMVEDLNMPVKVKVMPTVREDDGLALSSRNAYLTQRERKDAPVLYRALSLAEYLIRHGLKDKDRITNRMKWLIAKIKNVKIDYIEIVDLENLMPVEKVSGKCLIALAVRIGKTRLIDNILVKV